MVFRNNRGALKVSVVSRHSLQTHESRMFIFRYVKKCALTEHHWMHSNGTNTWFEPEFIRCAINPDGLYSMQREDGAIEL